MVGVTSLGFGGITACKSTRKMQKLFRSFSFVPAKHKDKDAIPLTSRGKDRATMATPLVISSSDSDDSSEEDSGHFPAGAVSADHPANPGNALPCQAGGNSLSSGENLGEGERVEKSSKHATYIKNV